MTEFRDAFMRARRRLETGEDPEAVVPELIELAEADEEISMAESLWNDDADDGGERDES
jgi:hypothetical protein